MFRKVCTKCGLEKDLEGFYINKESKFGRSSTCKLCKIDYEKEYYENNKEKIRKQKREYYEIIRRK